MSAQAMVARADRRSGWDRRASATDSITEHAGSDGRRRPNAYAFVYRITAPWRKRQIERALEIQAAVQISDRNTELALRNLKVAEAALAGARVALAEHVALLAAITADARLAAGDLERLEPQL